jgi:hypothetical protein
MQKTDVKATTTDLLRAHVQVGPIWNVTTNTTGVKQNIILSAPGPARVSVPYNLTVSTPGNYTALSMWEWNATTSVLKDTTGGLKVGAAAHAFCKAMARLALLSSGSGTLGPHYNHANARIFRLLSLTQ